MAELIIQSGKLQGKRLMLPDREVFIGRDEDCHVRLSSSLVSRRHCSLTSTPEGVWVKDLASQNGTLVNDELVTGAVLLKPGDVLQVGATVFQVPLTMPTPPGGGKVGNISDAEIASWLSDDAIPTDAKSADTTVIRHSDPGTTEVPIPRSPLPAPAKPAESVRRTPRTVKEQAAEIIRRHWEMVRAKQQNPS
ncbi:MAG: FHA domain-containing protein [Planctomycetaceae bacterium]